MGLILIWEWPLTLPSFGLADRQTIVHFRSAQTGLRIGCGTSCLHDCRSCCRLILAPCAIAWSAAHRSVPRFSLPVGTSRPGIHWEVIPESTETTGTSGNGRSRVEFWFVNA